MFFDLLNAVSYLERSDGVIAIPGLDSYCLAARADREAALARIHRISRNENAFILIGRDREAFMPFIEALPEAGDDLIHRYWPGALVLILEAQGTIPQILTAKSGKVRIMQPSCSMLLSLLSMVPQGVLAVSCAGRADAAPAATANEVYNTFGDDVDFVLPDDELVREAASPTVVSVGRNGELHILRSGGIVLD